MIILRISQSVWQAGHDFPNFPKLPKSWEVRKAGKEVCK
jgi:hypothetical protein